MTAVTARVSRNNRWEWVDTEPVAALAMGTLGLSDPRWQQAGRYVAKQPKTAVWPNPQVPAELSGLPVDPAICWLSPDQPCDLPGVQIQWQQDAGITHLTIAIQADTHVPAPLGLYWPATQPLADRGIWHGWTCTLHLGARSQIRWYGVMGGPIPGGDPAPVGAETGWGAGGIVCWRGWTQIQMGTGSQLQAVQWSGWDPHAWYGHQQHIIQEAHSVYQSMQYHHQGGGWTGEQITVWQQGSHATTELNGCVVGRGRGVYTACRTVVHAAEAGTSKQICKSVLHDRAHVQESGRVVVSPGVAGIKAQAHSHHALLSAHAHACAQPELAIESEAVWCAHGASTGQLDPQALFYLTSRGIPEADAQSMLQKAFVSEAVPMWLEPAWRVAMLDRL